MNDYTTLRARAVDANTSQTGTWAEHVLRMEVYHFAAAPNIVLALLDDVEQLRALITKLHAAKGRYHSQVAMSALYDACGLPNEKPIKDLK